MVRTVKYLALFAGIVFLLVACNGGGDNAPPAVTLTAPADGATVFLGKSVTVGGEASDPSGIKSVSVLIGGAVVAEVLPAADGTWSYPWVPGAVGEFQLSARAKDNAGYQKTTAPISVTVSDTVGTITGTISRFVPAPESVGALAAPMEERVMPGDVFVVFEPAIESAALGVEGAAAGPFAFTADGGFTFEGHAFEQARFYPQLKGLGFYRTTGLDEAGTRALIDSLRATAQVSSAFPNRMVTPAAVPNDTYYPLQWHYEQLNLPAAWDVEDGSTNRITVAVLDTGRIDHEDLAWAPGGANFTNWDGTAPSEGTIDDPYTLPGGDPHGTHVAGTIGAITNNDLGVAGVNWNVDLLPVKVIGEDGWGTTEGIIEGLIWITGEDDPAYGGWVNDNIPRVVNMSLGGYGFFWDACTEGERLVYEYLAERGIIVVAAAGNGDVAVENESPAACPNVISVGATGPFGGRAYYSNYGFMIDVMAPGGDAFVRGDGEIPEPLDAVLSTVDVDDYAFYQGTSMASPHVAGVVSLMLAREPNLTFAEVRERLHNASVPLTWAECQIDSPVAQDFNMCGAGLLDAEAALLGKTLTSTTAVAYAVPYADGAPPALGWSSLASLESLARYKVAATKQPSGDFTYALEGLEPGKYLVIGLELRDAENGISGSDRLGTVEEVEVTAGADSAADIVVQPIYTWFE